MRRISFFKRRARRWPDNGPGFPPVLQNIAAAGRLAPRYYPTVEQPMPRISYINGQYLLYPQAKVHIEDRGYVFADGVYEVIALINGKLLDEDAHLARLEYSLNELSIPVPVAARAMRLVIAETIRRNRAALGTVYLQVTRGIAPRNHPFPVKPVRPSLAVTIHGLKTPSPQEYARGIAVITRPDLRWGRTDIKSIALLPNILAKQEAVAAGVKETWLIKEGVVTEGSSSNAYMVDDSGTIVTHPASRAILGGVTRHVTLNLAREAGMAVREEPFTADQLLRAREAFGTSTTMGVVPVTEVDGKKIGGGAPGEVTGKLIALYGGHARKETGKNRFG